MSQIPSLPFRARRFLVILLTILSSATASTLPAAEPSAAAESAWKQIGAGRGVCAVLGLPEGADASFVVDLARGAELLVYFQSPDRHQLAAVRDAAEAAGLLGSRVFVDGGAFGRVHLADNLASALLAPPSAAKSAGHNELLRVLRPRGKAIVGDSEIVKPIPQGTDSWSHVYHGPDNNPQSTDQLATVPYLTQFLAEPMFCPMPEVSVAAGGRVFRAFGHIAHKANQNAMLNTLVCADGYNGTILWKRPLAEGFMIHRNTMIATPEVLYLADNRSCKLIDPHSGEVTEEIVVPPGISDGRVWKWMALVDGVLYALVGGKEVEISTQRSQQPGLGHWPWGMWQGHDYKDPKTNFGFGRTFIAVDPRTKTLLWIYRDEDYLDSRGVCMRANRIYAYSPGKSLKCLDAKTGRLLWSNSDADLLAAIGPDGRAQQYITGYSTTAFIKCNDQSIFFAGPQRSRLVAARTENGKLLWQKDGGNYQLVLRQDALYAAGPQQPLSPLAQTGCKLDYQTGAVLARLPMRRACTRATGSVDSIFFRASGGTVRIDTATNTANHIAPMRPPCQDGVIISDGNLYWGPWMCGCQLSLYGHIGLTSAGDFNFRPGLDDSRLKSFPSAAPLQPLTVQLGDWPTYQGDNVRSATAEVEIPREVARQWTFQIPSDGFPTAPVTAGELVFCGDRNGVVRAIRAADGKLRWKAYTGGPVYFPPAVADGRLLVGSADGRVYAFEAATGRPLWTFRAAPAERWIPVYGKLISTWPVSGGVVVQDGVVYAAAGITHYDGTHVYAIDAATGNVKWYNDTSGTTSTKTGSGVSLQGDLYIRNGELRFLGGGVHRLARYDLATGKCLNQPNDQPSSNFATAFYAYFPEYGKYLPLSCTLQDGKSLHYDPAYEGSQHSRLALLPPLPANTHQLPAPQARALAQRRGQQAKPIWQGPANRRYNAFAVAPNLLLAAGHTGLTAQGGSFLAAINLDDGSDLWQQSLPGPVVKGGIAVNHKGQIFITLENAQILAFAPQ